MARAFRCDVCKEYDILTPYIVTIAPPYGKCARFDMCEECFATMNKTIMEQRGEYLPIFEECFK